MDIIKQIEYTLSKADVHEYNCKIVLEINNSPPSVTLDNVLNNGIRRLRVLDYYDPPEQRNESFNVELGKLPEQILECFGSNILATRPTSSQKSTIKIDESVAAIVGDCYRDVANRIKSRRSKENKASKQLDKTYSLSKKYRYGQVGLIKDRQDINDSDMVAIRAAEEIIRLYIWLKGGGECAGQNYKTPTKDNIQKHILKSNLKNKKANGAQID